MSRNFSRTTYTKPDLNEICSVGMVLRAKLVIEKKYDEAKQVFAWVLEMCPNDVEIMTARGIYACLLLKSFMDLSISDNSN